jgi:hypothetical protein
MFLQEYPVQEWLQYLRTLQFAEGGTEPFNMRSELLFHVEAKMHYLLHLSCCHYSGTKFITNITASGDEGFFLIYSCPLAGHYVIPDIIGIPFEFASDFLESRETVMENFAALDGSEFHFWGAQPIDLRDPIYWVEPHKTCEVGIN